MNIDISVDPHLAEMTKGKNLSALLKEVSDLCNATEGMLRPLAARGVTHEAYVTAMDRAKSIFVQVLPWHDPTCRIWIALYTDAEKKNPFGYIDVRWAPNEPVEIVDIKL